MSDEQTPARVWRDMLRRGGFSAFTPDPDDPDGSFAAFVEAAYEDELRRLAQTPNARQSGVELGIYILSLCRLTFGHLEAVEDVLRRLPALQQIRHPTRALASAISSLIPHPTHLDVFEDGEAILAWVGANEQALAWDEVAGKFVLGAGAPDSGQPE